MITDVETPSPDLTVTISYMPQGDSWTTVAGTYYAVGNYWYFDWVIPSGATEGLYDVMIEATDGDGGSSSRTELAEFNVVSP